MDNSTNPTEIPRNLLFQFFFIFFVRYNSSLNISTVAVQIRYFLYCNTVQPICAQRTQYTTFDQNFNFNLGREIQKNS